MSYTHMLNFVASATDLCYDDWSKIKNILKEWHWSTKDIDSPPLDIYNMITYCIYMYLTKHAEWNFFLQVRQAFLGRE